MKPFISSLLISLISLPFTGMAEIGSEYRYENDSISPNLDLVIDDRHKIANPQVDVLFEMEGVAALDYLKIQSTDKFYNIRMGYEENRVFGKFISLPPGSESLTLTLKDFGGTNWNTVKFSINEAGTVILGNYTMTSTGDGWVHVTIPLSDFGSIEHGVQLVSFPDSKSIHFAVKEIRFGGGEEDFIWFGRDKFDNAIKASAPYELVLHEGPIIDEIRLTIVNQNRQLMDKMQPFSSISATLSVGENALVGIMIDKAGNLYYSDTVYYEVGSGISAQVKDVSCKGESTGSITLAVDGGTPPYTYEWSNGANTRDISDLQAGLYHVTVLDSKGREAGQYIKVDEPNTLTAKLEVDNLVIQGGEAPYTYSLDGGSFQPLEGEDDIIWQQKIVGSTSTYLTRFKNDSQDNIIITGKYHETVSFGDDKIIFNPGESGHLIVKYKANGDYAWSHYTTGSNPRDTDVVIDKNDHINILMDVDAPITLQNGVILKKGVHILNFDPEGNLKWIRSNETPESASQYHLPNPIFDIDANGNIYLAFEKVNDVGSGGGPEDLLIIKYDALGNTVWEKEFKGKQHEGPAQIFVNDNGDIILSGNFNGDLNFDDINLQPRGTLDMFIARITADGQAVWAKSYGSIHSDFSYNLFGDNMGNIFLGVSFDGPVNAPDLTLPQAYTGLIRMNASSGEIIWTKSILAYPPSFVKDGLMYTFVNIDNYVLYNYDGEKIGALPPFEVYTSDNLFIQSTRVIDRNADSFTYTISKRGQAVAIVPEESWSQQIDVKDANGCIYSIKSTCTVSVPSICYVTATSGSGVEIVWDVSGDTNVNHYNIYKDDKLIGQASAAGRFYDSLANTDKRSYRYNVSAVGNCESKMSTPHETMHLSVNEGNRGEVNLIWDDYNGLDYESVNIYRGSSRDHLELIDVMPANLFTFTDLGPIPAEPYYQIGIEVNTPCGDDEIQSGRMNEQAKVSIARSNVATSFGMDNLQLFPNPAEQQIHVRFDPDGDEYELQLIEPGGRVVKRLQGVYSDAVIQRDNLPAGIYTVLLRKNSGKPLYGRVMFK